MASHYAVVSQLHRALSAEFLTAAGLSRRTLARVFLQPFVWPAVHRFARLAAEFDRRVSLSGLLPAIRWALPRFVEGVRAYGSEQIPATGPLVVASNHPGSYDGLAIASFLPRSDLKVIVTGRPFFRRMVGTAPHLIYTPFETHERMSVVRESIRHLRAGGALLIFPRGRLEPDPAVLPHAERSLDGWSPSLPLLLRHVPETHLLVTIVSGVLAPACLRHPLTRLRKAEGVNQLWAEFIQVSQQVFLGRRFGLMPTVRFAPPVTVTELGGGMDLHETLAAITARARQMLAMVPRGPEPQVEAVR